MDHNLLGKILASVLLAATDAGAILTNPLGVVTDPKAVASMVEGFLGVWLVHPAAGATPEVKAQVEKKNAIASQ